MKLYSIFTFSVFRCIFTKREDSEVALRLTTGEVSTEIFMEAVYTVVWDEFLFGDRRETLLVGLFGCSASHNRDLVIEFFCGRNSLGSLCKIWK